MTTISSRFNTTVNRSAFNGSRFDPVLPSPFYGGFGSRGRRGRGGDVFGRNLSYGGGFVPEGTTVSFSGVSGGAIVRNVNIGYEQGISRIWDLGTGQCFFVAGHTNGTWNVGRVAAGRGGIPVYSVCGPGSISFSGSTGLCKGGRSGSYSLNQVVTTQVGVSVTSDDMIINEGVGGTFLYLSQ